MFSAPVATMPENDPDDITGLPLEPTDDELPAAYQLCRRKLTRANRSRSALQGHDTYRGSLIVDLQAELQQLEDSFRQEATERAAVHALNERITRIVQSLEVNLDEAALIVEERDAGGLNGWVVRLARLLPVVLKLRKATASARRLLGLEMAAPTDVPPEIAPPVPPQLLLPPEQAAEVPAPPPEPPPSPPTSLNAAAAATSTSAPSPTSAHPETASPQDNRKAYGPLVLRSLDYAFGLLLLAREKQPQPEGLIPKHDTPWLPGHALLVPRDPEDPDFAPIEAGFLALDRERALLPELQSWLDRGLLPFALDPQLQLPRLVQNASLGSISHVLVHEKRASAFQEQIGGTGFELDDDHWLGFQLTPEEAKEFWRSLDLPAGRSRSLAPRLSTRGGVAMVDRQGFLAIGLGLPLLATPPAFAVARVQLQLADGRSLEYVAAPQPEDVGRRSAQQSEDTDGRQIWQPSPADRRLVALAEGPARFVAELADGSSQQRLIQLTGLPASLRFQRVHPLAYREDWGVPLGPLDLPEPPAAQSSPSPTALQWARQRLHQGDATVNALFEQQMLESLSARFQRRASLQRRDFLRLYEQLRNKPDEWPGFPEAVLRGWCEGGWLEEGVERRSGRWRLQPIDPRLVRLNDGGLQLVGLLSARGLMAVIAMAYELGLTVRSVPPTCADMPRGWRFYGAIESLGPACGLPVVDSDDWVRDPRSHAWIIKSPLPSDSPPWPNGLRGRPRSEDVCGRRGEHHFKPPQPLPEGHRASIDLKIDAETSNYGKRRWHSSVDPVQDVVFSSCHRNRVVLHAVMTKTKEQRAKTTERGLWPFGFTDSEIGQIDRLYDCEAYLPLPIARWAALYGRSMPGPTRHQPGDHTYRYHVPASLHSHQLQSRFLPFLSLL
jgi:hypothetical protein